MKLARLNNLPRENSLFLNGEPDLLYNYRQVIVVEDNYDFQANNATDISSIPNWIKHYRKAISKANVVAYMQDVITDWATHDQAEKDMFLDFVIHADQVCCLSTAEKEDLQLLVEAGFTILENGGVNALKTWNGTSWI